MKVKILFVILLITFNSNAQLTNSYKRIKKPTLTNDSLDNVIDVRFNSSKTSKKTTIKPKKTIFDLSERAQDELPKLVTS